MANTLDVVDSPTDNQIVPLQYSSPQVDIHNILFIDNNITDYQVFVDGCNDKTLPIVYDHNSDLNDVKSVLSQFTFHRMAFVFHEHNQTFLNNKSFFDLEMVKGVTDMITTHQVTHVDFLACNTLLYPEWRAYYEELQASTGVVVGASNDETGNLKYGGNWLMENTNENVENVYFTKNIEYYKYPR